MTDKNISWEDRIKDLNSKKKIRSVTCCIYNRNTRNKTNEECQCRRLIRAHSYDGESIEEETLKKTGQFTKPTIFKLSHKKSQDLNVYGTLPTTGCKFLRMDAETDIELVYDLLSKDCQNEPDFIISIYGGAKYFTLTERLEKGFIGGIISAASATSKLN